MAGPHEDRASLQAGWVIANHILVSFHVAFISSVLALPADAVLRAEVLQFIFCSPETIVSALFMFCTFHTAIAVHELGHFLTAARLNALTETILPAVQERMRQPPAARLKYYVGLFLRIPYGKALGVKREGLNYYPDAPYNLAVAAAGPRTSRNLAAIMLPPAVILLTVGLLYEAMSAIYVGRLLLGIGLVGLLDFLLADPGKYREFKAREKRARQKAATVQKVSGWLEKAGPARQRMLKERMQEIAHPRFGPVTGPWQFRNCGMGGRHTEKEYPESNISMQEAMFLILGARDYQEAQEMTVRLQGRLKEIIEKEEGCRVMGIGLEGGLAPYIERREFPLPEIRLWSMMKQAMEDCGLQPGVDAAIALDPAMNELEIAYRKEFNVPDAIGMYLFWRDKTQLVMDRDGVLDVYLKAIEDYEIPILSIEDGFSETDFEGWKLLLDRLGDRLFIIGDDLVTTNDQTIETAVSHGLINTALIKANQIGTLYETLLAMLVALGRGLELVVSHRSKSPNDDMEAHIALASNALGLKCGGGANTERLVKYQSVMQLLRRGVEEGGTHALRAGQHAPIHEVQAYEEPTNAGVPTVSASAEIEVPSSGVLLKFKGATPLGTSAGTGEAIHLVDKFIEYAEHPEVIDRHKRFFKETEPGIYTFTGVDDAEIGGVGDEELSTLYERTQRYEGKGCLNAVENVFQIIAPFFEGRDVATLTLREVDRALLGLELRTDRRRGKLPDDATQEDCIRVMQRKQNLGMNAILSASLAFARAVAHVRGEELYELLREEMLSIIDRVAAAHQVPIRGNTFADYVEALREVARILQAKEKPLYEVLREVTGIYENVEEALALPRPPPPRLPAESSLSPVATDVLSRVATSLGREFEEDAHHGLRHAKDLLRRATLLVDQLGAREEVDWRVLSAAIGLHDAAPGEECHGEASVARAVSVLQGLEGFDDTKIQAVKEAILLHDDHGAQARERRARAAVEAKVLHDVEQLDALGIKGIYRTVSMYMRGGTPLEKIRQDVRERFDSLCFDASLGLGRSDYDYTLAFLNKMQGESVPPDSLLGATGVVNEIRRRPDEDPVVIAGEALEALAKIEVTAANESDHRFAVACFEGLLSAYGEEGAAAETRAHAPEKERVPPVASATLAHLERLTEDEAEETAAVTQALYGAYVLANGGGDRRDALSRYLQLRGRVSRRVGQFGIINNRMFKRPFQLTVPFHAGDTVFLYRIRNGKEEPVVTLQFPPGTLHTDASLARVAGEEGDPIDLERELFGFDHEEKIGRITVRRIRDIVALLERVNETQNVTEAIYVLRHVGASLCSMPPQTFLGAKNLQPELKGLNAQLVRLVNGPAASSLPLLTRILVRNASALVMKPNVIDRIWNETIDLSEVHIRGSAIVNELRRSSHHSLGKRTLLIAQAYLDYLRTGSTERLSDLGFDSPAPADIQARSEELPVKALEGLVHDLETLLGTSEIVSRIRDWQQDYAETLLRCEFGSSIPQEVERLVSTGISSRNRWTFYHILRSLRSKIADFPDLADAEGPFLARIDALLALKPDDGAFDVEATEKSVRSLFEAATREMEETYQQDIFTALERIVADYEQGAFFDAFTSIREFRKEVHERIQRGGFSEQRYYLHQLDCLLEEMGYLAVRHISSEHEEKGVDVGQCLAIVKTCIANLPFDGLSSRELHDLSLMLDDRTRTRTQLLNTLASIQQGYHKLLQRVTVAYEKMSERLGLGPDELRIVIANMSRYMHDLRCMVHLTDLLQTYIRDVETAPAIETSGEGVTGEEAISDIVHLSQREDIKSRVEAANGVPGLRELYGAKGSGLVYISYLNIPTCDGFVLPATLGRSGLQERDWPRVEKEVRRHLEVLEADIERRAGVCKRYGSAAGPLVLAVRGGSVFSMPGILATVVFVGMNDSVAASMARDDPWQAYDSYRRFLTSYSHVVLGVNLESFQIVERVKERYSVEYKEALTWEAMREITEESKACLRREGHGEHLDAILEDPMQQLTNAVRAVFGSWTTERARRYRRIKGISDSWHTAVTVQEMAFGNRLNEAVGPGMDETRASLTGVVPRSRMTDSGRKVLTGEFKFSAAGDDLVGGSTPSASFRSIEELPELMPMLTRRVKSFCDQLRRFMGTDQEVEFTVERGMLRILQSRRAETVADQAVISFADPGAPVTRGVGIRGGGFCGLVAFDEEDREKLAATDFGARKDVHGVLMVLQNPTPDEIPVILSADGLLTATGGSSSHAAVAVNSIEGRGAWGVMSAAGLRVDAARHEASLTDPATGKTRTIRTGDVVSIDGTTGEVFLGSRMLAEAKPAPA